MTLLEAAKTAAARFDEMTDGEHGVDIGMAPGEPCRVFDRAIEARNALQEMVKREEGERKDIDDLLALLDKKTWYCEDGDYDIEEELEGLVESIMWRRDVTAQQNAVPKEKENVPSNP